MQYMTFFFEMKKQSPEAQRWLEDRQYGQANDGFSMELSYNQDNIPICLLEVDTEKVEIIHHPFPEAFHILEERFRWTQVTGSSMPTGRSSNSSQSGGSRSGLRPPWCWRVTR